MGQLLTNKRETLAVMEYLGVVEYLSAPGLTQFWHSGSRCLSFPDQDACWALKVDIQSARGA